MEIEITDPFGDKWYNFVMFNNREPDKSRFGVTTGLNRINAMCTAGLSVHDLLEVAKELEVDPNDLFFDYHLVESIPKEYSIKEFYDVNIWVNPNKKVAEKYSKYVYFVARNVLMYKQKQ